MIRLHAAFNELKDLPSEIRGMTALQELYLRHNALSKLAPELGGLRNLKVLDILSNRIVTLPPSLGVVGLNNLVVDHQQGCLRYRALHPLVRAHAIIP